jgi:hypothetical protein
MLRTHNGSGRVARENDFEFVFRKAVDVGHVAVGIPRSEYLKKIIFFDFSKEFIIKEEIYYFSINQYMYYLFSHRFKCFISNEGG